MSRVFPLQKWLSQVGSQVRMMEQSCHSGALLQRAGALTRRPPCEVMIEEGKEESGYV